MSSRPHRTLTRLTCERGMPSMVELQVPEPSQPQALHRSENRPPCTIRSIIIDEQAGQLSRSIIFIWLQISLTDEHRAPADSGPGWHPVIVRTIYGRLSPTTQPRRPTICRATSRPHRKAPYRPWEAPQLRQRAIELNSPAGLNKNDDRLPPPPCVQRKFCPTNKTLRPWSKLVRRLPSERTGSTSRPSGHARQRAPHRRRTPLQGAGRAAAVDGPSTMPPCHHAESRARIGIKNLYSQLQEISSSKPRADDAMDIQHGPESVRYSAQYDRHTGNGCKRSMTSIPRASAIRSRVSTEIFLFPVSTCEKNVCEIPAFADKVSCGRPHFSRRSRRL